MNKWSKYFMCIAENTKNLSKDPKVQVGAVITKNKKILSIGYNGAPRKFPDELVPTNNDGIKLIDKKRTFMCHAELNAILNYEGHLKNIEGADIYVTTSPCSKCAIMLAQIGVKRVIYKEQYHKDEEVEATEYIFKNCNIDYIKYKEED